MNIAEKLCCPHLLDLEPYQSARRIGGSGEVWLNANELPFPARGMNGEEQPYNRYPNVPSPDLLGAYADYSGVARERLLCTRGADEGIELLIRAFCTPAQDRIITTPPTYGMYQVSAAIHHVEVVPVSRLADFSLDLAGLESAPAAKLVFICSPNNPTGNLTSAGEFRRLLEFYAERALIVVDEAYVDFCPERTAAGLIDEYPNLVLVRTLSKAFGQAAIRCGFVLARAEIIDLLSRIIAPYPVPLPVEQVALRALSTDGLAEMREHAAEINRLREELAAQLRQMPGIVRVLPSLGNFVLVEFADEPRAVAMLKEAGIVVRTPYTHGLIANSQRISIGTAAEMDRVVEVLRQLAT